MKKYFLSIILMTLLLVSFVAADSASPGGDWWMANAYLDRNAYDGSVFTPTTISADYAMGGASCILASQASPVLFDGYLFGTDCNGGLHKFDPANINVSLGFVDLGTSSKNTPAYADGFIYLDGASTLYKVNVTNMTINASYNTGAQIYTSPLVVGDYVYVGNLNADIIKLNKSDLSLVSSYNAFNGLDSTPAYDGVTGAIFLGDDAIFVKLDPVTMTELGAVTITSEIDTDLLVVNGNVYFGTRNGGSPMLIMKYDAATMAFQGSYDTGADVDAGLSYADGSVYAVTFADQFKSQTTAHIYEFNEASFPVIVSSAVIPGVVSFGSGSWTNPVIAGGYVFYGTRDGKLTQVSVGNVSNIIGSYDVGSNTGTSPVIAQGMMYFGNINNNLYQRELFAPCIEDWVYGVVPAVCANGTQTIVYTDSNACGTVVFLPGINGTSINCTGGGGGGWPDDPPPLVILPPPEDIEPGLFEDFILFFQKLFKNPGEAIRDAIANGSWWWLLLILIILGLIIWATYDKKKDKKKSRRKKRGKTK